MMKEISFFDKKFTEKRFVNVSICHSNIKAKKGTYYGKVCKLGRINSKNLLSILKERSPQLDTSLIASAFEQMVDIVLDMVCQGYNVDFFNLGTFSLGISGKIEVNEKKIERCQEDVNYDVSDKVNKNVNFAFKFSPSQALKKSLKNVKMAFAIKKNKVPKIEKIEDLSPHTCNKLPAILKVKGEGLKLLGEKEEVGVYIEEKSEDNIKNEKNVKHIKVNKDAIIQNENKTLILVLDQRLKEGKEYSIKIATQGVSSGKVGKELKSTKMNFILQRESIYNNCLFLYNG